MPHKEERTDISKLKERGIWARQWQMLHLISLYLYPQYSVRWEVLKCQMLSFGLLDIIWTVLTCVALPVSRSSSQFCQSHRNLTLCNLSDVISPLSLVLFLAPTFPFCQSGPLWVCLQLFWHSWLAAWLHAKFPSSRVGDCHTLQYRFWNLSLISAGDKGALFARPYYGTATAACNQLFEFLSWGGGISTPWIMYPQM